jgi:hypothetical protein
VQPVAAQPRWRSTESSYTPSLMLCVQARRRVLQQPSNRRCARSTPA